MPTVPLPARARDRAAIALPALLALALGLIGLRSRSLGFDEGTTFAIVSQHGSALGSAIARDGGNMSGYYLLMHLLVGWLGSGPAVLRAPSVAFTAVTVALVAALGLRLFDRRVGLLAGLLCAVSLPLVYWAQTARAYAPMVAFVCAGFLAFVGLADESAPAGRRRRAGVGYAVAMVLACYCTFVAVLVVPVQVLALARRPRALRALAAALVAIAVCCLPLAILAARRGSGQLFWVPHPSRKVESQVLQSLTSAGLEPSFHPRVTTTAGLVATMVVLLGGAVAVLRARRVAAGRGVARRGVPRRGVARRGVARRGVARAGTAALSDPRLTGWPLALTLEWIAMPLVGTFVAGLVGEPLFLPRDLLTCLPAVALALAVAITHPRLPRAAALAALVIAFAVRAVPLAAGYGVSPEPWRQATAAVLARARPGDCVAFYPLDARNAFQYYTRSMPATRVPRPILPALGWGTIRPFVERYVTLSPSQLSAARAGCRRLWFVSSHEGQEDGPARARANRAGYHRLDARLEHAFGRGPIRQYGYASPIHVQLLARRG